MTKQQLEIFVRLAKTRNYSIVAENMHMSQPTISYQIKKLEEELGYNLFIRDTRSVNLTSAGFSFYEDCQGILDRLNSAISRASNTAQQFQANLSIGCISSMMPRLEKTLELFHSERPDVYLSIFESDPFDILTRISRREFSLAICSFAKKLQIYRQFHFHSLIEGHFICAVPADHPLAERRMIQIADLEDENLILLKSEKSPPELRALQETIQRVIPRSITYYSGGASLSVSMIQARIGIAVMPDFVCPDKPGIVKIPIDWPDTIQIGVYWEERSNNKEIMQFISCADRAFMTSSC